MKEFKEAWKLSKWFRFIVIWSAIYFITAILLYYVVFDAPFEFQLVWNVLSRRELTIWFSIGSFFVVGFFVGVVMLLRKALREL
jgi:ABC-type transport system involved in multi-copper enzyme maturation permease subunit